MANKRIYYAIQEIGIAPDGVTPFTAAHVVDGLQSCGMNTRFNIEQVFEMGQGAIYQNVENIPDVEVTLEKHLDGRPLIYHLATAGATSGTLIGRSNRRASLALSIFDDTMESASGAPISEVFVSGVFVSSLNYNFPIQGGFTESVTLVGNNKIWLTSAFTFTGYMNNDRVPGNYPPIGVAQRQHIVFGNTNVAVSGADYAFTAVPSVLPIDIDGIDAGTGYNLFSGGQFGAHVQSIRVSCNLGREALNELGRKGPYHRFVNFPVEVRCDIEVLSTRGDMVSGTEAGVKADGTNLSDRPILISTMEGTKINLGNRNILSQTSYGGGNAGTRGGNATTTYSFVGYSNLLVTHPADPTVALR
jgi:hypothetical protein